MPPDSAPIVPRLEWLPFLSRRDDVRWIRAWEWAEDTYARGDETMGRGWHDDRYTRLIATGANRDLFERAGERLLRYDFYPHTLIEHSSRAAQANRSLRLNDRIVQRIHVVPGLLDAVTATRVSDVIREPRRLGLAYVTTEAHFEIGEWWCWVEWQPAATLTVNLRSISRPGPRLPRWQRPFARRLQLRAHAAGLARFAALVAAP
jgi:uncharacterized protein (UPF0548 family)